jgi:hypothetical protein
MVLRIRGLGAGDAERGQRQRDFVARLAACLGAELTVAGNGRVTRAEGEPDASRRVLVGLFDQLVASPRELTISAGRGQRDVLIDRFERREVDLDDLDQLPEAGTAGNPQIFTRCEALVHILAEYLLALRASRTYGAAGYGDAHRGAFAAQAAHRAANGQRGGPVRQNFEPDGGGGFVQYEDADGNGFRTDIDITDGNITGVR